MANLRQGSIRLFRFAGIDLFLHWSWFLVAAFEISDRAKKYPSLGWNVLEYLALFLIVMLHEFGHSLACRQVGGQANQIVLWPLGGVAYVNPPPRPGATLWSIAAGPLVNVALLPVLLGLGLLSRSLGWAATMPNARALLRAVFFIDLGLLVFNILPIYPLDGGQILRSLLWFVLGRARSLMVATILGFVGVAGFIGLDFWKCGRCGQPFDTFQTRAACPHCATQFAVTKCLDCGAVHPMSEWFVPVMSLSSTFPASTI